MILSSLAVALTAGLLLGSFLNVCISRLPEHRSIVFPGSHCPRCGAAIRPRDNIPLLSFILLGGRCRACRKPISLRYPLTEAALALLFAGAVSRFPSLPARVEASVLCFLLLGLFFMDVETMRLPDSFTVTGTALGLLQTLLPGHGLGRALHFAELAPFSVPALPPPAAAGAAGAGAAGLLLLVRFLYRTVRREDGLGLGDVKLAAMLGVWLGGLGTALALAIGILLAACTGVLLLAFQGRAARRLPLPFGAFLCAGAGCTLFVGARLLAWYFHFWL